MKNISSDNWQERGTEMSNYTWIDYDIKYAHIVEPWFDDETMYYTGCDEGWNDYYLDMINDPETILNQNSWVKIIYDGPTPIGIMSLSKDDPGYYIAEFAIAPDKRGKGIGTAVLQDLLHNSQTIIGETITEANACIFPDNPPSQKAFEKAGFHFDHAHPDGDAWYYVYKV